MERHELWRSLYRADRYMRYLPQERLEQRLHDIVVNILELTPENKLGLVPLGDGGEFWLVRLTEVLEEYRLRFGQYPAGFRDGLMAGVHIPLPSHPLAEKAVTVVSSFPLKPGTYLAKYNPREYMVKALGKGEVFIRAASSFEDPSLNPARRAQELEVSVQAPGDSIQIEVFSGSTGSSKGWLRPIGNITYALRSNTDFLVYSLSTAWSSRLFVDFEADACLLIVNPQIFLERLLGRLSTSLPGWHHTHGLIRYYDPLRASIADIELGTNKHFRYAYQKEYRIISIPPEPVERLQSTTIELGSLEDCCRLVVVD